MARTSFTDYSDPSTPRDTFFWREHSKNTNMSSALHCFESDLDDAYNDTWGQVLPWNGGDIPGTELGYRGDDLAKLNEPLDWDQPKAFTAPGDTFECAPSWIDTVYNTGFSYESPVVTHSANDDPTFPISMQYPPVHCPQYLPFQAESHSGNAPLQVEWHEIIPNTNGTNSIRGALHSHSTASPELQIDVCSLSFGEHFDNCQGNNGSAQSLQAPGWPNFQPQEDKLLPSSPALDQHTAMERAPSYESFVSNASGRSNRSRASSSSQKEKKALCPLCQMPFTGDYCKRNLTRHMQSVHAGGSFPYKCKEPDCNRKYKRSDALRVHQVKIHPGLYARVQPRPRKTFEEE